MTHAIVSSSDGSLTIYDYGTRSNRGVARLSLSAATGSTELNAVGTGGLVLNNVGTGGVQFCNGEGTYTCLAKVDGTRTGIFNGGIKVGRKVVVDGNGNLVRTSLPGVYGVWTGVISGRIGTGAIARWSVPEDIKVTQIDYQSTEEAARCPKDPTIYLRREQDGVTSESVSVVAAGGGAAITPFEVKSGSVITLRSHAGSGCTNTPRDLNIAVTYQPWN